MNYLYFANIFNFVVAELKLMKKVICFWAGVTNITLVLRLVKNSNFYYIQTAKVVN